MILIKDYIKIKQRFAISKHHQDCYTSFKSIISLFCVLYIYKKVGSRDDNQVCDPIKRLKCEESSSPSGLYSYPSYLFSPYGWATDPSLLMYWYNPALASGASSNNASTLAARLSAFKPWSPNTNVGNGKYLSQNISQVMPQGFNNNSQTHKLSCEPPLLQNPEKIASKRYVQPKLYFKSYH